MEVESLKLNNFRNYKCLDIKLCKGLNIIHGENGQGKTNIVEAIFLCAAGRSHRTARDIEMLRQGEEAFNVNLNYTKENEISGTITSQNLCIEYGLEKKKKAFLNEIPFKRLSDMVGNFNAVMFSPEEMAIIKEGPSNRRHFIDIALCQSSPSYMYHLQRYNKAVEQKNKLLKKITENYPKITREKNDELNVWNTVLAELGARIMANRYLYTEKLNKKVINIAFQISGEKENLEISYTPSVNVKEEITKEKIMDIIDKNSQRELKQATALYGPHRDDWAISLCKKDIRVFGSQGQQRTATIALKIAEALVMEEDTGQKPVIILDDIMSELDQNRQRQLTMMLSDRQVFATCTEREIFRKIAGANVNYYEVINGNVIV